MLLFQINELQKSGDVEAAVRLQKVFLDSIREDQKIGRFSSRIELDRKAKKAIKGASLKLALATNTV